MPSTKRASVGGSDARPAKVPKSGKLAQVAKGLTASDLPKDVRDMLGEMLGPVLGAKKESRDKFQSKVVELVEGVLAAVDDALKSKVAEAEAFISEDDHAKGELDSKATIREGEAATKRANVLAKKCELAEAAKSFRRAREVAADTKAQGETAEVEVTCTLKERDMLAGLVEDLEKPAGDGHTDCLVKKLSTIALSESIVVALPAVLAKASSDRSSFDTMVLTSVREELQTRIAVADEVIQKAEPTRVANADAMRRTGFAVEEMKGKQLNSADAYWKAAGEEEQLTSEVVELRAAIRKLRDTSRKHLSFNARAKTSLEAFHSGPKQAFEELRDAVETPLEPVQEAEIQPSQ